MPLLRIPFLNKQHSTTAQPPPSTPKKFSLIEYMPLDIIFEISSHLDYVSTVALRMSCRAFYKSIKDPGIDSVKKWGLVSRSMCANDDTASDELDGDEVEYLKSLGTMKVWDRGMLRFVETWGLYSSVEDAAKKSSKPTKLDKGKGKTKDKKVETERGEWFACDSCLKIKPATEFDEAQIVGRCGKVKEWGRYWEDEDIDLPRRICKCEGCEPGARERARKRTLAKKGLVETTIIWNSMSSFL